MMEQFEKWNRSTNPEHFMAVFTANRYDGWKAALEWALSEGDDCGDWWAERINKELDE